MATREQNDIPEHRVPFQQFWKQVEQSRWLEPDAHIERCGEEVERWIEERLSEYCTALGMVARDRSRASIELRPWSTRSAWEAAERWSAQQQNPTANDRTARDWHWALLDAQMLMSVHPSASDARTSAEGLLKSALPTAINQSLRWKKAARKHKHWVPPYRAIERHAHWLVLFPERAEFSPWKIPVELWFAGVWPFVLEEGTMGIYIPQRGPAHQIVTDPSCDTDRGWPGRSTGNLPGLDYAFGFGPPAYPPK